METMTNREAIAIGETHDVIASLACWLSNVTTAHLREVYGSHADDDYLADKLGVILGSFPTWYASLDGGNRRRLATIITGRAHGCEV